MDAPSPPAASPADPAARRHTWVWRFDRPVEAIWPLLADTARFNEAAELPKHVIVEEPQLDGAVRYFASARQGPFRLRWEERPVNWVANRWFEHCRDFSTGPLRFLCARLRMVPEEGGCRAEYTIEAAPRNGIGRLILATRFFPAVGRKFAQLADDARRHAKGEREEPFAHRPPRLAEGAAARLPEIVARIEASPHGHGLAERLARYVTTRQEVDVWTIRPLKLARRWQVPERAAVELCLEAVAQGLLRLRWDLLCPRCQVPKASALKLDELPTGVHCPSCNIDYGRDYSRNVELAFEPAKAIRPLEAGEYCLWGPLSTPHIVAQVRIGPGERRDEPIALAPGRYRLRTLEPLGEIDVDWREGGFPTLIADGRDVTAGPPAPPGVLALENRSTRPLTAIVETRRWARDAFTADRAFALQAFRNLFSAEVLRPGDNVEIDRVALMFTDLKGSTALYERIGDPGAYALVREHFAILGRAIRAHHGALVKTIGDAVMGAFADPLDALFAAAAIQREIGAYNRVSGREPIAVRVGLHLGRCIAVTLNDRLDYYGTNANFAARLEGQGQGGDVILSEAFAADGAIRTALAGHRLEAGSATLKGFEGPQPFWRLGTDEVARLAAADATTPFAPTPEEGAR